LISLSCWSVSFRANSGTISDVVSQFADTIKFCFSPSLKAYPTLPPRFEPINPAHKIVD
jgi:hypothetical protein